MDQGRPGGGGLHGIEDEGKLLVLRFHRLRRSFGLVLRLRQHHGHGFAGVADLVHRQGRLVPQAGAEEHGAPLPRDHLLHPGHGFRRRGVDGQDLSVGDACPDDLCAEHPGKGNVGNETGLACRFFYSVHSRNAFSNVLKRHDSLSRHSIVRFLPGGESL